MYDGLTSYAHLETKNIKIRLGVCETKKLVAGYIPFSLTKELYFLLNALKLKVTIYYYVSLYRFITVCS